MHEHVHAAPDADAMPPHVGELPLLMRSLVDGSTGAEQGHWDSQQPAQRRGSGEGEEGAQTG